MIKLAMTKHNVEFLRGKFRGSLLGALLGDCLGAPFEGDEMTAGGRIIVKRYLNQLEDPEFKGPMKQYTDDTAMLRSVALTLINKPEPNYVFMAKLFVRDYFDEPNRGYGAGVVSVFKKLRNRKFDDVFQPAKEQFDGSGSFGNGGAMRIAPVALQFFDNTTIMNDVVKKSTSITHTNILGINGAILEAAAVQESLLAKSDEKLNVYTFVDNLIERIKPFEIEEDPDFEDLADRPYEKKLHFIKHLLQQKHDDDEVHDEVVENLGNSISAVDSVPTAIYCFLHACSETTDLKEIFKSTIEFAISLGGDTDTIASMAGAIAGAYVGDENLSQSLIRHCEKHEEIKKIADDLLTARQT